MVVMTEKPIVVKDAKTLRPVGDEEGGRTEKEYQLESTETEVGEVELDNQKLKTTLAHIVKDYQHRQMHFFDIIQQEQSKKPMEAFPVHDGIEDPELVVLSLGTSSTGNNMEEKTRRHSKSKDDDPIKGLAIKLDCGLERSPSGTPPNVSPENSYVDLKEKEIAEPRPPSKIWKNVRSGEEEISQQTHVKRARVSVRARCGDPTIYDGCQWRKYGQKIAKGNPCPRAYYRCTVAPACPVRKQVQRCAEDRSILITTYEGIHNHPIPASAAAMASTTSAAACMLMSGSSTFSPPTGSSMPFPSITSATTTANLNGLNFPLEYSRHGQFYLPNSSISSSSSHSIVTLDLTTASSSNFTITPSSIYSSTGLNFSSSDTNALQTSCTSGFLDYGTRQYSSCQTGNLSLGTQSEDNFYRSYVQKSKNQSFSLAKTSLTDTIAKAITSDPSFQSALAAAITSYVGAPGAEGSSPGTGSSSGSKWGEYLAPAVSMENGSTSRISTGSNSSNPNHQKGISKGTPHYR